MNHLRPTRLAAIAAALTLLCVPFTSLGQESQQERGEPSRFEKKCYSKGLARASSRRGCFRAIMRDPELMALFNRQPSFQDGRLSIEELWLNAAARQIGTRPDIPQRIDPNEEDAEGLYEEDGRTLKYLDTRELSLLESAPLRVVSPASLPSEGGPTFLQNFPPIEPPPGFPIPSPGFSLPPPNPNNLDIGAFLDNMHAVLQNTTNGYALKVRQNGQTRGILQWNWGRNPDVGDSPARGWNTDRRMHVASVSKFMTAIGLMHLLENTDGVDVDDPILPWLPDYWDKDVGGNDLVTFAHLMDHISGYGTGGSNSDWPTMKGNVEAGAVALEVGSQISRDYENMNFGLLRILIATVGGYINTDADFSKVFQNDAMNEFTNDLAWDAITANGYNDYMQTYVFNPSGAFPVLSTNNETVLGYRFDSATAGWDGGDLSCCGGGYGWHMTISELLDVTRAFRAGNIVSPASRTDILQRSFGLNSQLSGEPTPAGPIYFKPGRWTTNLNRALGRSVQAFVLMAPDDIEIVVFVNSEIADGVGGFTSLQNLVRTVYLNNINIVSP